MLKKLKDMDHATKTVIKVVAIHAATIATVVVLDRMSKKNND